MYGDDGRVRAISYRELCQVGNQAALSGARNVLREARPEPIENCAGFGSMFMRVRRKAGIFLTQIGERHGASGDIP